MVDSHRVVVAAVLGLVASNAVPARAQVGYELEADVTVGLNNNGDFDSIQAAIDSVPRDNRDRVVILLRDGIYHERFRIDRDRITIRGESRQGTVIYTNLSNDAFNENPDDLGRGVVNIHGDDVVLENLTVMNTYERVGPHAFTIFGRGTRTILLNVAALSNGADTVSLWDSETGMYYHADCHFQGAVDYVCPRGWCHITDSTFQQVGGSAGLWHAGGKDKDQKFVIRNSYIDGYEGFTLGRHHYDAAFYLLDCTFSRAMSNRPIFRKTYPDEPERDRPFEWGHRKYFHHSHREGGDPEWLVDNLYEAEDSPTPEQVTAEWTFAGKWDPESSVPPEVVAVRRDNGRIVVRFGEDVSVRGDVALVLAGGGRARYAGGSGTRELTFEAPSGAAGQVVSLDTGGGVIVATVATRTPRVLTRWP